MKKILSIIFLFVGCTCWAQLVIIQNPISSIDVKPTDIFKISIQNNSGVADFYFLKGSVLNNGSGKKVLDAISKSFSVKPGLNTITQDLIAAEYTIYSELVKQSGIIPFGQYQFCVELIKTSNQEEVVDACVVNTISPLSPPYLLMPENESSVSEPLPVLTWLPPMPLTKNKVTYDLKLVEILPNQTPYDAIQRNYAVLDVKSIKNQLLQYPSNAIQLKDKSKYAWQVVAKTETNELIGETEIWSFTKESAQEGSQPKATNKAASDSYYIVADEDANKSKVSIIQTLRIISNENVSNPDLVYTISDQNGTKIPEAEMELISEGRGRFTINFKNPKKLFGKTYKLTIVSSKNRNRYIVFDFLNQE
ncbi:MAG: hypothetical protein MUE96_08120 [Bacteroidia bacterium]|jgi:hypothetical protein|nr:hypothetical protein [Bacteroidia bacterium]